MKSIYDTNRIHFKNTLNKFIDRNIRYKFNTYILNEMHHTQSFFLMCTGKLNPREINIRLTEIVDDYKFQENNNYTFTQLIRLDKEWYPFFKENIWPCGLRKKHESSRGLERKYVDDIMTLKNRNLSLRQAINLFNNIKYKNFCYINNVNVKL